MIASMTREITITPVLNGFVCKVGCQKVVFESVSGLLRELGEYLSDPDGVEKRFVANAVNKMSIGPQCEPCDSEAPCQNTSGLSSITESMQGALRNERISPRR